LTNTAEYLFDVIQEITGSSGSKKSGGAKKEDPTNAMIEDLLARNPESFDLLTLSERAEPVRNP